MNNLQQIQDTAEKAFRKNFKIKQADHFDMVTFLCSQLETAFNAGKEEMNTIREINGKNKEWYDKGRGEIIAEVEKWVQDGGVGYDDVLYDQLLKFIKKLKQK